MNTPDTPVPNDQSRLQDLFALTDEQIVGLGAEDAASEGSPSEGEVLRDASGASRRMTNSLSEDSGRSKDRAHGEQSRSKDRSLREDVRSAQALRNDGSGQADAIHGNVAGGERGIARSEDFARNDEASVAPAWLAEWMRDPRYGEEAKELWDGKQRAEKEAAAYREVFATPEDARALKEIYPGGLSEARAAAERARTLEQIDAAYYRGDAGARMQLAQRMMAQDPAAFREMVEAGLRLLGGQRVTSGQRPEASGEGHGRENGVSRNGAEVEDANNASLRMTGATNWAGQSKDRPLHGETRGVQALRNDGWGQAGGPFGSAQGEPVAPEVVRAYGEFEKSANAELEKSVGGAIARAMEQALPNLRSMRAGAQREGDGTAPLQERLARAVREEVEEALKSDGQLGEQVARVLAGKRFDGGPRAQVVRLIDARAQQLVPGAVKRVVSAWTQATLTARGKGVSTASAETVEVVQRGTFGSTRGETERQGGARSEKASVGRREAAAGRGRRIDYGKMSDEEIVGL